jgi:hypothetical protein
MKPVIPKSCANKEGRGRYNKGRKDRKFSTCGMNSNSGGTCFEMVLPESSEKTKILKSQEWG